MAFTSSMKLPTSKTKSRKQFFTVGQAFALAAGAASLATVATALFASHMFSISFQQDFGDQSLFDGPTSTVYSHTVISSDQLTAHWGRNSRFLRKLRTNCGEEMPAQAPMKMNHDETIQEESVPLPQTTNEDDIGPGPHVVWLMSFPNRYVYLFST